MKRTHAFSWVEVLVAIAVLWVVAVITIPNLPVLIDANRMARSQRAAMSLSSLALAAKNSGHPGWRNRSDAVRDLINGVAVTNPADPRIAIRFQSKIFTSYELASAMAFLTSDGTTLLYVPTGGQSTNL
ncbi:MAG: type II secretion system protein [Verrucomicrobiae bacterium]